MSNLKQITLDELQEDYPLAFVGIQQLCADVQTNDPEMFEEDPWSPSGFRYYVPRSVKSDEGTVIAERITVGMGSREPDFIWSGAIVDDPHDARWFCSEDGDEDELELGRRMDKLAPGGIGGF